MSDTDSEITYNFDVTCKNDMDLEVEGENNGVEENNESRQEEYDDLSVFLPQDRSPLFSPERPVTPLLNLITEIERQRVFQFPPGQFLEDVMNYTHEKLLKEIISPNDSSADDSTVSLSIDIAEEYNTVIDMNNDKSNSEDFKSDKDSPSKTAQDSEFNSEIAKNLMKYAKSQGEHYLRDSPNHLYVFGTENEHLIEHSDAPCEKKDKNSNDFLDQEMRGSIIPKYYGIEPELKSNEDLENAATAFASDEQAFTIEDNVPQLSPSEIIDLEQIQPETQQNTENVQKSTLPKQCSNKHSSNIASDAENNEKLESLISPMFKNIKDSYVTKRRKRANDDSPVASGSVDKEGDNKNVNDRFLVMRLCSCKPHKCVKYNPKIK